MTRCITLQPLPPPVRSGRSQPPSVCTQWSAAGDDDNSRHLTVDPALLRVMSHSNPVRAILLRSHFTDGETGICRGSRTTGERLMNHTALVRGGVVSLLSSPGMHAGYGAGEGGCLSRRDEDPDLVQICILKRKSFGEMQLLVNDCTSSSSSRLR